MEDLRRSRKQWIQKVTMFREMLVDVCEENKELQKENNHLKLRVEELDDFSDEMDVKRSKAEVENDKLKNGWYVTHLEKDIETLKAELRTQKKEHLRSAQGRVNVIKELQVEVETLQVKLNNGENCDHEWYNDLKDVIKSLEEENDSLKDEAVKWNRKYNKVEYPKDYQKEAKEHFHHNPKCKGVRFHMLDYDDYEYDENDGLNGYSGEYNGSLMAEDCLLEIDNEGSSPTFH